MSRPYVWDTDCPHGGRPGRDRAGRAWCPSCRRLDAKRAQTTAWSNSPDQARDPDLLDLLDNVIPLRTRHPKG